MGYGWSNMLSREEWELRNSVELYISFGKLVAVEFRLTF